MRTKTWTMALTLVVVAVVASATVAFAQSGTTNGYGTEKETGSCQEDEWKETREYAEQRCGDQQDGDWWREMRQHMEQRGECTENEECTEQQERTQQRQQDCDGDGPYGDSYGGCGGCR